MNTIYADNKFAETAQNWVNRPFDEKLREAVNLTANETADTDAAGNEEFFLFAETTPEQDARTESMKAEGLALSALRGQVFTDVNGQLLYVEIIDEAEFAFSIGAGAEADLWTAYEDASDAYNRAEMSGETVTLLARQVADEWPAYDARVVNPHLGGLAGDVHDAHCQQYGLPDYHFAKGTIGRIQFAAETFMGVR